MKNFRIRFVKLLWNHWCNKPVGVTVRHKVDFGPANSLVPAHPFSSNPLPKQDWIEVTMMPCFFNVLPSSPWIAKAAVVSKSTFSKSNSWNPGWSFSYVDQNCFQTCAETLASGAPASLGHRPFFTINPSQSLGSIHGKVRPLILISLKGRPKVDPCFSITFWTSLSLWVTPHCDHCSMPHLVAWTSPMSAWTAWAVRIWLTHEASVRLKKWHQPNGEKGQDAGVKTGPTTRFTRAVVCMANQY